jgi:hypothetical protein
VAGGQGGSLSIKPVPSGGRIGNVHLREKPALKGGRSTAHPVSYFRKSIDSAHGIAFSENGFKERDLAGGSSRSPSRIVKIGSQARLIREV